MTAYGLPANRLYTLPERIIGKHAWRLCIIPYRSPMTGEETRATAYYWRRYEACSSWKPAREWRSYNSDDGATMGLPATLRDYFHDYEEIVRSWIDHGHGTGEQYRAPQGELFA